MEWCFTHHIRAQYIETTLQCTEMKFEYKRQFQASPIHLVLVLKTMNCAFCVPAKPGTANILLRLMKFVGRLLQTALNHF